MGLQVEVLVPPIQARETNRGPTIFLLLSFFNAEVDLGDGDDSGGDGAVNPRTGEGGETRVRDVTDAEGRPLGEDVVPARGGGVGLLGDGGGDGEDAGEGVDGEGGVCGVGTGVGFWGGGGGDGFREEAPRARGIDGGGARRHGLGFLE